jgi:hypothetical protein
MRSVGTVLSATLVFVWSRYGELRAVGRLFARAVREVTLLMGERVRSFALERRQFVVTPAVVCVVQMVVGACHGGLSGVARNGRGG